MVLDVTSENFEDLKNSEEPVILDFYADWCGPCQMLKPVFESLSSEFKGKIKFGKVDTQNNQELSAEFGIQSIPCIVFLKNGKEVNRIIGLQSEDEIKEKIQEIL